MNAKTIVFLFPGQGAHKVGMGRELSESSAIARQVFDEAFEILGDDFRRVLWHGGEDELRQTVNTQPALLVHSVAALRELEAHGVEPAYAAGHSLGEYSAHVAAGSISFADALRLVRRRGELMQEAGESRPGTMAPILGPSADQVSEICRGVREGGGGIVVPANLNSPKQTVISGEEAAVGEAMAVAVAAGARRFKMLDVGGAFHSPLMEPAEAGLLEALSQTEIQDARFPVVANVSARPVSSEAEIRKSLGEQLLAPVRWEESVRFLLSAGTDLFIEVGCGSVLRGLLRAVDRDAEGLGVEDPGSLKETLKRLSTNDQEIGV